MPTRVSEMKIKEEYKNILRRLTGDSCFSAMRNIYRKIQTFLMIGILNEDQANIRYQKIIWQQDLRDKAKNLITEFYGYGWGDPEKSDNPLGNYRKIKNELLLPRITDSAVVMEIGFLGGKWTQYLIKAKKIILVDLDEFCFKWLRPKLKHNDVTFYKTKGNEVAGIEKGSIDFIFSVDTFVRVPKKAIFNYFKDFAKVLRPGGRLLIHLPCREIPGSAQRHFVDLSFDEIKKMCVLNGLGNYKIHSDLLIHGVILEAVK